MTRSVIRGALTLRKPRPCCVKKISSWTRNSSRPKSRPNTRKRGSKPNWRIVGRKKRRARMRRVEMTVEVRVRVRIYHGCRIRIRYMDKEEVKTRQMMIRIRYMDKILKRFFFVHQLFLVFGNVQEKKEQCIIKFKLILFKSKLR
uniref:Uncharacterized protein n=1 Tax=Cacopsylla melanoneura TaxID=428564 RepID=A0A8D8UDL3_9HEMI